MVSSNPVEQIEGMAEYIASRYGNPTKALEHEHAFHWYNRGGMLHMASGGLGLSKLGAATAHNVSATFGQGARKNPKAPKKVKWYGHGNVGESLTLPWHNPANLMLHRLGVTLESGIPIAQERYTALTNDYSLNEFGPGTERPFIVTEGPYGEQIHPYENVESVHGRLLQLEHLMSAETSYRSLLSATAGNLSNVGRWAEKEIVACEARITKIQKRINAMRHMIETQTKRIEKLRKHLSSLKGAKHQDKKAISSTETIVKGLEKSNIELGGSATGIGSAGKLHALEAEREVYKEHLSTFGERRNTFREDKAQITGAGNEGGSLAESNLTLHQLEKQMGELGAPSLAAQLKKAEAQAGKNPAEEELATLLKTQNEELSKQLAVSQAQYKVLSQMPPFGGSFAYGGIVPGPIGAPRTIVAHGGERVGKGGGVQVVVHDGAVNSDRIEVIADGVVQKRARSTARNASRPLPSRGGGLV